MRDAEPSRTAFRVALRRAAHQRLDVPPVLDDPLAIRIVGAETLDRMGALHAGRRSRALRAFVAVRSRLAEDEMARALGRGAVQYVVLGAGLDTFAFRNPYPDTALRVFEVDHPATQAWKRQRLGAAGIHVPPSLTFAPVDFDRQTLADGLAAAGWRADAPTFFSWLGVTMYLTEAVVMETIEWIGRTPQGGGLVFDIIVPRASLSLIQRFALDALSARVAAAGEPFRAYLDPVTLTARMTAMGFRHVQAFDADALNARYFRDRADGLRVEGRAARVVSAEM